MCYTLIKNMSKFIFWKTYAVLFNLYLIHLRYLIDLIYEEILFFLSSVL